MKLNKIGARLALIPLIMVGWAQGNELKAPKSTNDATVLGKLEYPYTFKYEGNPLSRMHSAADPDVNVWDGVVWMYCSQDRKVDPAKHKHHYDAMDGYHAFSSTDLINWTDHGEIFHSSDVKWAWEKGGFLWAPGAARKAGKYYLYYPLKDKAGRWRVGVAVSDSPTGPFVDSGRPLAGLEGIDPKVFVDDDGQAYIYNNPGVVAKLKPSMIELAEEARKIVYAPEEIMKNETLQYLEGPYLHKRNGRYYFSYTNWKNKTDQGFYAIGTNPYGPFEWKGAVGPRPAGAQDHHSIVEFKGQWYYFYHIAEKEFPLYKESQGRIACYDKLYYNEDGTMQLVRHTR
ncbi:MAG: family 43 glycosylhydrolase [Lacunisphaera sp.]|nr:family 43 glycosylhydrolase [Lacunisphaera sp.]